MTVVALEDSYCVDCEEFNGIYVPLKWSRRHSGDFYFCDSTRSVYPCVWATDVQYILTSGALGFPCNCGCFHVRLYIGEVGSDFGVPHAYNVEVWLVFTKPIFVAIDPADRTCFFPGGSDAGVNVPLANGTTVLKFMNRYTGEKPDCESFEDLVMGTYKKAKVVYGPAGTPACCDYNDYTSVLLSAVGTCTQGIEDGT